MKLLTSTLLAILVAVLPACRSDAREGAPVAKTEAPAPTAPAKAAGLSDPQIAAIVVVANQIDVDAGALAVARAANPEVKKLAERMVTDHTGVNQAAVALATRLGVTPEETDASRALKSGGDARRQELEALSGAAFDRAYVDNEVAYHEAVIGVLDGQLIPSATHAELKALLVDVRPAFVAHLEHARQIQATLAGQQATGHAAGH